MLFVTFDGFPIMIPDKIYLFIHVLSFSAYDVGGGNDDTHLTTKSRNKKVQNIENWEIRLFKVGTEILLHIIIYIGMCVFLIHTHTRI